MTESVRPPSRTAVLTAAARALHREQPPPWVLDDQLARGLAGDEGLRLADRLRADLPAQQLDSFVRWVCVRSRWPEDIVEKELEAGVTQHVILGAGLDSFAYRRRDLLDRLRVFEVDHPASQAWKRDRLARLGVELPPNVVFSPVDFERQTLGDGLQASGFDFDRRAVFSWIGVTMYLSSDAIEATLATVARCPSGSRLVLTYNQPRSALRGFGAELEGVLAPMMAELGEPMISLFAPAEIEQLLGRSGFVDVVHFGPKEAMATYFKGRSDVAFAGVQRLVAASVA